MQVLRRQRIRILVYHNVIENPYDPFCVSPHTFADQMQILSDSRLPVVSLEHAMHALQQPTALHSAIVITIDDAYIDILQNAIPVLTQHHFPATIYAVTGKTGQPSDWGETSPSYPILTWSDLTKLSSLGFCIGSHTHTHAHLPALEHPAMEHELTISKELVQVHTGQRFIPLAYPYGEFADREKSFARKIGYPCAVAASGLWGNGKESDIYALRRELILKNTKLDTFRKMITGTNDFIRFIRFRFTSRYSPYEYYLCMSSR